MTSRGDPYFLLCLCDLCFPFNLMISSSVWLSLFLWDFPDLSGSSSHFPLLRTKKCFSLKSHSVYSLSIPVGISEADVSYNDTINNRILWNQDFQSEKESRLIKGLRVKHKVFLGQRHLSKTVTHNIVMQLPVVSLKSSNLIGHKVLVNFLFHQLWQWCWL